jgi:hypothetical protein
MNVFSKRSSGSSTVVEQPPVAKIVQKTVGRNVFSQESNARSKYQRPFKSLSGVHKDSLKQVCQRLKLNLATRQSRSKFQKHLNFNKLFMQNGIRKSTDEQNTLARSRFNALVGKASKLLILRTLSKHRSSIQSSDVEWVFNKLGAVLSDKAPEVRPSIDEDELCESLYIKKTEWISQDDYEIVKDIVNYLRDKKAKVVSDVIKLGMTPQEESHLNQLPSDDEREKQLKQFKEERAAETHKMKESNDFTPLYQRLMIIFEFDKKLEQLPKSAKDAFRDRCYVYLDLLYTMVCNLSKYAKLSAKKQLNTVQKRLLDALKKRPYVDHYIRSQQDYAKLVKTPAKLESPEDFSAGEKSYKFKHVTSDWYKESWILQETFQKWVYDLHRLEEKDTLVESS